MLPTRSFLYATPKLAHDAIIEAALAQDEAALARVLKDWSIDVLCKFQITKTFDCKFTPAIYLLALRQEYAAVQFLLKHGARRTDAIAAYAFRNDDIGLESVMPQTANRDHIRAAVFGSARLGNKQRLKNYGAEQEPIEPSLKQARLNGYAADGDVDTVNTYIYQNRQLPPHKRASFDFNTLARTFAEGGNPDAVTAMIEEGGQASKNAAMEGYARVNEEKQVKQMQQVRQTEEQREALDIAAIRGFAYGGHLDQIHKVLQKNRPGHLKAALEGYISAGNFLRARTLLSEYSNDMDFINHARNTLLENFRSYTPLLNKLIDPQLSRGIEEIRVLNLAVVEWILYRDQEHNATLNWALLNAQAVLSPSAQEILNELIAEINTLRPIIFPAADSSPYLPAGLERVFYIAMLDKPPHAPCKQVELDRLVKAAALNNKPREVKKLLVSGASRDAALYGYARAGKTVQVDELISQGADRLVAIAAYASVGKRPEMEKHLFHNYPPSAIRWHASVFGAACGGQDSLLTRQLNYTPPDIDIKRTPDLRIAAYKAAIFGDLRDADAQKNLEERINHCFSTIPSLEDSARATIKKDLERSALQARILRGTEHKESKSDSPADKLAVMHAYAICGKTQQVDTYLSKSLDPISAVYGYALMGNTTLVNDLLERHPNDPALRRAALSAYKKGVYAELFHSVDALESYRHTNSPKGKAATALAQNARNNLEDYLLTTNPLSKASAGGRLKQVLKEGRKTMSEDRNFLDKLAHFALGLTVIGLLVVLIPHRLATSSWYLNSTPGQKLLGAVQTQAQRIVRRMN